MKPLAAAWLLISLAGSSALAQDVASDWEIMNEPAKKAVAAVVVFESGITIGVRCLSGALGVVISGLPPDDGPRRTLRIGYDADPLRDTRWVATTNPTVVVHEYPAIIARRLRLGGQMNIVVPGAAEGGRNLRYVLDLPPSATAIESVLTACDKPLVDPRDAELEDGDLAEGQERLQWVRRPSSSYPDEAMNNNIAGGYAVITCLTERDGSLSACEVESEHPPGSGFGRASLAGMHRARLAAPDGVGPPITRRRIGFRNTFRLTD